MNTTKKLLIGAAALFAVVTGIQAQEEIRKIPAGVRIAGEPRGYVVRIESESEDGKGVYTFEAENRDVESVTRIQHHGEIEDLHTLKVPMGMVNLSQIEINTSGLREIHLSHDTSLNSLVPEWNGHSFVMPSFVLTITTSADTPAKDINWNQIYLLEPNQYHDGYKEPQPIKITAGITMFAPSWLKDKIRHYGGSGEYRNEVLKMLHPEIHYETRFISIIHWRSYQYTDKPLGSGWGRIYKDGRVSTHLHRKIRHDRNLSALDRFRKREGGYMFLISYIGSYSVKHSIRLPEYISGILLPALVRRDPETGETITVPPLPTIITTNKFLNNNLSLKPEEPSL